MQASFDSGEVNSSDYDSSSLNSSISEPIPPLLDLDLEITFITLDTETGIVMLFSLVV